MAVGYRVGILANNGSSTSTDTDTFALSGSGATVGDVGIMSLVTSAASLTMTTAPSGWTIASAAPVTASNSMLWTYWKVLNSLDVVASLSWQVSGNNRTCGIMDVFSGVDAVTPVEAQAMGTTIGSTNPAAPAVTSLSNLAWIYNVWTARQGSGGPATIAVPGITHTARSYAATAFASSGINTSIRGGTLTTPGAAGSYGTYTAAVSPSSNEGMASLALKPAAAASGFFYLFT